MRNAPRVAGTVKARVTAANTTAFAHSTGSRDGTAASVARIMPVAYSPVTNRTPRTPIASCAKKIPARLREVGSKPRASWGSRGGQCDTVTVGTRTDRPTMNTTAASRENTVERRDRSFVHSDRTTRACVTLFGAEVCGRGVLVVAVLI